MIRINLLPVRQTRKLEAARRELALAVAGGVVVLVGGLVAWGALQVREGQLADQNRGIQAEIDRLAADVAKVDEMEKFKAELERKLDVIASLRAKKTGPVHMLDELTVAAPERLQLTKLDEDGGSVKLEGVSVTNEVISQFLRSLDASPYFESVYLQNIEAMPPQKNLAVTLKRFQITAKLVTPEEGAVEAAAPVVNGAPNGAAEGAADGAAPAATPAAAGAAPAAPADAEEGGGT